MIRRMIGKCATNNDDHYHARNCQCWWLQTSRGRLASNEIQMVGLDFENGKDGALEQALSVSYKRTKFEQMKVHLWVDQHSCCYSLKHIKWNDSWHSHSHTAIFGKHTSYNFQQTNIWYHFVFIFSLQCGFRQFGEISGDLATLVCAPGSTSTPPLATLLPQVACRAPIKPHRGEKSQLDPEWREAQVNYTVEKSSNWTHSREKPK